MVIDGNVSTAKLDNKGNQIADDDEEDELEDAWQGKKKALTDKHHSLTFNLYQNKGWITSIPNDKSSTLQTSNSSQSLGIYEELSQSGEPTDSNRSSENHVLPHSTHTEISGSEPNVTVPSEYSQETPESLTVYFQNILGASNLPEVRIQLDLYKPDIVVALETWKVENIQIPGFRYNFCNPANLVESINGQGRNSGGTLVSSNQMLYRCQTFAEYFQYTRWYCNGILFISL